MPPRRYPIRSLPSQDICHQYPFYPRPPEVPFHRQTIIVGGTRTKRLPSAVFHMPRRPSPSVPLSPQQPTAIASSLSRASTSLKLGAPGLGPSLGQTCHTGRTRGGFDSPPPRLLYCPEGVGEKRSLGFFSVRTLSLGIPSQGTSIGKVWSESTPYNVLVSRTYLDPPPPPSAMMTHLQDYGRACDNPCQ